MSIVKTKLPKGKEPVSTGKMGLMVRIEMAPLDVSLWEELANRVDPEKDFLSSGSLDVIIAGLKAVADAAEQAATKKTAKPVLSSHSTAQFIRLSKSYNNPKLLKEIGTIYLNELSLPTAALHHFERARHLGYSEKELTILIESAAVIVQKQQAREKGGAPTHSGIDQAQHARPVVADAIRKTDRLLLPSKLRPPPNPTATKKFAPAEKIAESELPATTEECLVEAKKALEQGQLSHAHAFLLKANEKPASDLEMWRLWMDLGLAYYEANAYPSMEAAYDVALKFGRNAVASYFNLALAQHLNENLESAMAFYLTAERIEPNNPKVWCNLGVLYFQKEQYARAETALRRAVEARPNYARAWDNLGSALGAQNKLDEALEACQKAVEYNPAYPEAHFKIGLIHIGAGRQQEAEEAFRHAWKYPVLKPFIYAFIGIIRARSHQFEESEASIRLAVATAPACGLIWLAWNEQGLARFQRKEYDKAIDAYNEALKYKPDEPDILWFNMGVASQAAGNLTRARQYYQSAISQNGHFFDAWLNMGIVLAKLELHSDASMAFRSALRINPESPRAWYDLGVSLEIEGKKEEARSAYARCDSLTLTKAA